VIDRRGLILRGARALVGLAGITGLAGHVVAQPPDNEAARRAGLDPGAAAWSGDGRWWLVADRQQPRLLLFSADGQLRRDWVVASLDGRQRSRVAALQASSPRRSFVVALQDLAELWEISLDPQAEPVYDGLVHDYRMAEAVATPGYLGLRRASLARPLQDFRIDPSGQLVLGVGAADATGGDALEVIHLAVRRRVARLLLDGPADLARLDFGRSSDGRRWLAVGLLQDGRWQCFDQDRWSPAIVGPCKP
jgi:hypothetical protein